MVILNHTPHDVKMYFLRPMHPSGLSPGIKVDDDRRPTSTNGPSFEVRQVRQY